MVFDTKIAIVVRDDLATWQKLNVSSFLTGGLVAQTSGLIGEPYIDRVGNHYHALPIQPIIILTADQVTLSAIHRRSLEREVKSCLYVEEMFATGYDQLNRATFARFAPDDARVVGIALRAEKKIVDKITKGAKMHP